jgi:peptidoglycan/LPS O-acetylase OafA/YrhL
VHVPVMFIFVGLRTRIAATSNTLPWALLVAVCAATMVAAQLVHVCVEKPSLALSGRLKRWTPRPLRWGRGGAVPTVPAAVYLPAAASGDGEPR